MEIEEVADRIKTIIQLMGELPEDKLKSTLSHCEDKISTYGLLHMDDLDTIRKRRDRIEAFIEFREKLIKTDEFANGGLDE